MGAIYDDYRDYSDFCKSLGLEPLAMRNWDGSGKDWYADWEKLKSEEEDKKK